MRKTVSALLAALLLVTLAACGNAGDTGGAGSSGEAAFTTDLAAFSQTLFQGEDAPMMMPIEDDERMEMTYPGLKDVARTQTVLETAAISAVAAEAAMVEVANPADVATVQAIFQARIDAQTGTEDEPGGAFYPETIEVWRNNAEIVTRGNIVCLFVGTDKDAMAAAFNAL